MHGIEPSCRIFQQASEKESAFKQGTSSRDPLLPDHLGNLADQAQFLPLIVLRQDIALFRRREAALRAEAELVERHELRRLFNALLYVVLVLKSRRLGRYETEHDALILDVLQGLESAGTVGIIFEEEAVDMAAAEENLRQARTRPRRTMLSGSCRGRCAS